MRPGWLVFGAGVASALAYVLWARGGFPLDDAWIHQVYARNLGWRGEWAFVPGEPSAGSTSPLWTVLLALGYALRIDFVFWTHGLNALLLGLTAWLIYRLTNNIWIGLLAAIEWHLVWAAASGMETILFCALASAAWLAAQGLSNRHMLACGALIGLAVWARPDGLTLLPFCGALVWAAGGDGALRLKRLGWLAGAAAVVLVPYGLFNVLLSGQVVPNTFFAKQAEYAPLLALPLWERLAQVGAAPLLGGLMVLAPGVALRARARWAMLLWAGAFLLAYALRLPVTYQHGRYLIPVIPVLLVVGGEGLAGWVQLRAGGAVRRVAGRAWVLAAGGVAVAFWGVGANALRADVRVVEGEMVAVAKWVGANVPAGSVVAAHDIGALGYFADVRLVDLAGLVSPEVIPLMGDEAALWDWIRASGAAYFINFPGWCPSFVTEPSLMPVFRTGPLCQPGEGNLHMTVYAIKGNETMNNEQ